MNNRARLVHAIRGPILLISIGILFALQQADILHFSQTWPLLIIVIGVMTLIERSGPRPFVGPPPPPYTPPGGYPPQYAPPQQAPPPPPPPGSNFR